MLDMALHELSQKELEKRIKEAHASGGIRKISDGAGLYLVRRADGGLSWQFIYTLHSKRGTYSLGTYPKMSLSTARTLTQAAREKVQMGVDPVDARRAERAKTVDEAKGAKTVAFVVREWLAKNKSDWSNTHHDDYLQAAEKNVFPEIGSKDIGAVTEEDVHSLLKKIEDRNALYMLTRVRTVLNRTFEYAIDQRYIEVNPVVRVKRKAFRKHVEGNHPALTTPKDFRKLLLALDAAPGSQSVVALRLNALVFLRPQNLRSAEWEHIHLDEGFWEVPWDLMKKERAFLVPLARQATTLLRNWKTVTGHQRLVFPGQQRERQVSENTFNVQLWRLGFRNTHSVHGFRASATTLLQEGGYDSKYTDKQLAHDIDDETEKAYNRAEFWDIRVQMMQEWADYMDALRLELQQPWVWFGERRAKQSIPESPSLARMTSDQP